MALIVLGKTLCAACGEVLQTGDDLIGLPHFATGPDDPYWLLSDAGFHRACYEALPQRVEIEERLKAMNFAKPSE